MAEPRELITAAVEFLDKFHSYGEALDRIEALLRSGAETAPPAALTVSDTAKSLAIGETTTWGLISDGEIRATKVGRRTVVPQCEIDRFIRRRLDEQSGESPAGSVA